MGHIGLAVLLTCLLSAAILFLSVIVNSLRTYSFARLQDAFKNGKDKADAENLIDQIVDNTEQFTVAFSWYLMLLQLGLFLLLMYVFTSLWVEEGKKAEDGLVVIAEDRLIVAYAVSFVGALLVLSIFSLAIPHAWAKYGGEKLLYRTYKWYWLLALAAFPVVAAQRGYNGIVRRLAGIADATPEEQQEEKHEEFISELEHHRLEGAVDEEEQEMIENVLELSDSTADEIMTPRTDITAVDVNSDLQTVLDTIAAAGHTRVPVYKENIDNIVGLVYAKDLLNEIGMDPTGFKLHEKMREAFFVPEAKPLRTLLHEFQAQKLHIAVVLDEYGGTAGIVTLEDILEELVGEIADEYEETPRETISRIDQDTIELDARTYVDDLNDQFEFGLPEDEDYETVGGFVFTQLGYIPKSGEEFEYENLKFTVLSAETRSIKRLRIRQMSRDTAPDA